MDLKRVLIKHLHNMRDLGGCPTTDGRVTKWNRLYRSDAPTSLTQEEWSVLKNLNISMLIDFRSDRERESTPVMSDKIKVLFVCHGNVCRFRDFTCRIRIPGQ